MSVERAQALVKRFIEDTDFAERLESTPIEQRRALLEHEGYGDVKLRDISQALPESAGGELTDDEFAAVAGGGTTATTLGIVVGMSGSVLASAVALA